MLSFSAHADCTCDSCGNSARHGFFITTSPIPGTETFYCTGCAQRHVDRAQLDDAIETHRQLCFERAERAREEAAILQEIKDDHHRDMVIAGWLDYAIAE